MSSEDYQGGAATSAGMEFQASVSAYWCGRILLQSPIGGNYYVSDDTYPLKISCETTDSIDDIRIDCSNNVIIYGQCKTSLRISRNPYSRWASVIKQLYHEFMRETSTENERRFALFYKNSNSSLTTLNNILNRYRNSSEENISMIPLNSNKERDIVQRLNDLFSQLEREIPKISITSSQILKMTHLIQLRLDDGESNYYEIIENLRHNFLQDPNQVNQLWDSIKVLTYNLQTQRGSIDRIHLRERIHHNGIFIRDSVSYREDLAILRAFSSENIVLMSNRGNLIKIRDLSFTISRTVVENMISVLDQTSFLVIGKAGTGKTGCMLSLSQELLSSGKKVWFWPANALRCESILEMRNSIGLANSWSDIFLEVSTGEGAIMIVDGLDTTRSSDAIQTYSILFELAIHYGLKVVASIRSFDLRYSSNLSRIFPSVSDLIDEVYINDNFSEVSHFNIPDLNEYEFRQVIVQFPLVERILESANQLRPILRNLFSLDLLCKMITREDSLDELSSTSTQADLFELYWQKRIDEPSELRREKEEVLTQIIDGMVETVSLKVEPSSGSGRIIDELISLNIINHPPRRQGWLHEENLIEFSHNLLFDYVADVNYVRPRRHNLLEEIYTDDLRSLFLRPSLRLMFSNLYRNANEEFWTIFLDIERSSIPLVHKYLGYLVIAEESYSYTQLERMLQGLEEEGNTAYWIQIIKGVIAAANYLVLTDLFQNNTGNWWLEFSNELIRTGNNALIHSSKIILHKASDLVDSLSHESLLLLNQASLFLIESHWDDNSLPNELIMAPIKWLAQTFSAQPSQTSEIIRQIISPEQMQRAGYIQAKQLAYNIEHIWDINPNIVVEIYDAVFDYVESDESSTVIVPSQVMQLTSTRRQDYQMIRYQLAEKYGTFLERYPEQATSALIKSIRNIRRNSYSDVYEPENFQWRNASCRIIYDGSSIWDSRSSSQDDPSKMLQAWQNYLISLASDERADEIFENISNVLVSENEMAALWRRLLIAGSIIPEFYANKLHSMILNIEEDFDFLCFSGGVLVFR